jgi:hypothetical protein
MDKQKGGGRIGLRGRIEAREKKMKRREQGKAGTAVDKQKGKGGTKKEVWRWINRRGRGTSRKGRKGVARDEQT